MNILNTKPHILLCLEKWYFGKPEFGVSNLASNISSSLELSDLADFDTFYFDEYYAVNGVPGDEAFLNLCHRLIPDLIVILWGLAHEDVCNPNISTLCKLKTEMKIPLGVILSDTVHLSLMKKAETILPFVDFFIPLDSYISFKISRKPEKYIPLWSPIDSRIFFNPERERDIAISFVGSLKNSGYRDRAVFLDQIKCHGIDVYHAGGLYKNDGILSERLSISEYAEVFKRSKISLNFCKRAGISQLKGRVFEAMFCGAMLLEEENFETARLFEPFVDYVPFRNTNDLIEKIEYYLKYEDEREKIARNGSQKAYERYSGTAFWKRILEIAAKKKNVQPSLRSRGVKSNLCRHFLWRASIEGEYFARRMLAKLRKWLY